MRKLGCITMIFRPESEELSNELHSMADARGGGDVEPFKRTPGHPAVFRTSFVRTSG